MVTTKTVPVDLENQPYEIRIGSNILEDLKSQLLPFSPTRLFLIYDENVAVHFDRIHHSLNQTDGSLAVFRVPAGERSKSISQAAEIWEFLAENRADRHSMVIAIGGGVIGDLAGFIAATYARGIPFFQIPTTLLAHVDSSVGGKTGVNLRSAKNMVGSFWQPKGVLIDTDTLQTLPDREYVSGLAEVIKYGLIMDRPFFEKLEQNATGLRNRDPDLLVNIIAHCCQLKSEVVIEDEREVSGRRAILNYGHTFAHGFETVLGYGKVLHGEAVAVGMLCAGSLAKKLGRVDESFCQRQRSLLESVGLPIQCDWTDPTKIIDVMKRDKKNVSDSIRFILPTQIGHVEFCQDVSEELIRESIEEFSKQP